MNREITEAKLKELLLEAWNVYKEHNPDGHYLAVTFAHGLCSVNNSYYERDAHRPINFNEPLPKEEAMHDEG